jgi:hypothetical protein
LRAGAVLQAVTHQGEGDSAPQDGDLVSSAAAARPFCGSNLSRGNMTSITTAALSGAGVCALQCNQRR